MNNLLNFEVGIMTICANEAKITEQTIPTFRVTQTLTKFQSGIQSGLKRNSKWSEAERGLENNSFWKMFYVKNVALLKLSPNRNLKWTKKVEFRTD